MVKVGVNFAEIGRGKKSVETGDELDLGRTD